MPLQIANLSELTTAEVTTALDEIRSLVQEEHPTLDVRRGVVHDHILYLGAQLAAMYENSSQRVQDSSSLLRIQSDPELADDDIVDQVLSNFNLTRGEGSNAFGSVTILVSKLSTVTVAKGSRFSSSGKTFVSDASYVARSSAENVQSDNDRVLTATDDGRWSFTINVEAEEEGSASLLDKGASLVPSTTIVNFVKAYATDDFTGGVDTETNEQLVARQAIGVAARALSGRLNMSAALHEQFPAVINDSVIGYGDAEMLRDQRGLFPVSFGGRTDWYVRTQELPQRLGLDKTATLIQKTTDGKGVWQITYGRDEAPGLYDVESIVPTGSDNTVGSFTILSDARSYDSSLAVDLLTPDITSAEEAAFSRYQTVVVQFKDDQTDTAALTVSSSTKVYSTTLRVMPQIAAIQSYVSGRGSRHYGGDALIKAPVPCFLSLSLIIDTQPGALLPQASEIKDALAAYVNRKGFAGHLHASNLHDIVHDYLPGSAAVSHTDMFGQILRPNGSLRPIRSSETLRVPDEPENMVTSRTVAFFLYPDSIALSLRVTTFPEI